jgi:hypothetical protein
LPVRPLLGARLGLHRSNCVMLFELTQSSVVALLLWGMKRSRVGLPHNMSAQVKCGAWCIGLDHEALESSVCPFSTASSMHSCLDVKSRSDRLRTCLSCARSSHTQRKLRLRLNTNVASHFASALGRMSGVTVRSSFCQSDQRQRHRPARPTRIGISLRLPRGRAPFCCREKPVL